MLRNTQTVWPLRGVELDDRSHRRADRFERDTFVEGVVKAAGLPIARVPVRTGDPVEQLGAFLRRQAGVAEVESAAYPPDITDRVFLATARSVPASSPPLYPPTPYPASRSAARVAR